MSNKLEVGKIYCSNAVNFYLYNKPEQGQYGYVYNREFAEGSPHIPKCCPFMLLKVVKQWDSLYAQVLYEDKVGWVVGFDDGPKLLREVKNN